MIALAVAAAFVLTAPALYFAITRASRDARARHRVIRGDVEANPAAKNGLPTGRLLLILVAMSAAGQGLLWVAIPTESSLSTGNVLISALGALLPVLIYGLFYALDRLILRAAA